MATTAGVGCIVVGYLMAIAAGFRLRPSLRPPAFLLVSTAAGIVLGIGATMLQDDPAMWAWVVTPIAAAVCTVAHVWALTAGSGPLRT